MGKIFLIIMLALASTVKSQQMPEYQEFTAYYLFNLGYAYQDASYFKAGIDTYLVRPNNHIVDLGFAANLGAPNSKWTVIPEAHLGYLFNLKNSVVDPYSSQINSAFWLIRTSASPWHITPEAGITILDLLEFTAGYGFEFRKHENAHLGGMKMGINIKLPFLLFWHD